MKVISSRSKGVDLIRIEDYFANFDSETNSYYYFNFLVNFLQSDVYRKNLTFLKVTIFNDLNDNKDKDEPGKKLLNSKTGYLNSGKEKANSMLQKSQNQVKEAQNKAISKIFSKKFSLWNSVNLSIKNEMENNIPLENIEGLYATVDTLESINQENDVNFLLDGDKFFNRRPLTPRTFRNYIINLITINQIDPSIIPSLYKNIDNFNLSEILKSINEYYLYGSLDLLTKDNVYYKKVKKKSFVNRRYINFPVSLLKDHCNQVLTVQFDVFEKGNILPVFTVRKIFDAPTIINNSRKIYDSIPNFILNGKNLKVGFDNDDNLTSSVFVDKKTIDKKGKITSYSKFAEKNKDYSPTTIYSNIDYRPENYADIYRCYLGNNFLSINSPYFKNLVHCHPFYMDESSMIIKNGNSGETLIDAINIPTFATKFRIRRRTLAINNYKNIPIDETNIIDFTNVISNEKQNVIDNSTVNGKIYEYTLEYLTSHGIFESSSIVHKCIKKEKNYPISVSIKNPERGVENNKQICKFTIESAIDQSEKNKIINELLNSNYYEFSNDLQNITDDEIFKLIFFKIVRLNLSTGVREEFNQFSVGSGGSIEFIDNDASRQQYAIEDLDPNVSYTYEVYCILKDTNLIFRDIVKSVDINLGNSVSNNTTSLVPRSYSFRPYVWRQPYVLQTGHMYAEDAFGNIIGLNSDKDLGILAEFTFQKINNFYDIINFSATRTDLYNVKLEWEISGSSSDYDHFVIIKEVAKKRSFIGSVRRSGVITKLGKNDVGTVIFYIVGISKHYDIIPAKRSNTLVITPEEFGADVSFY